MKSNPTGALRRPKKFYPSFELEQDVRKRAGNFELLVAGSKR